jgi:hypothetical protein
VAARFRFRSTGSKQRVPAVRMHQATAVTRNRSRQYKKSGSASALGSSGGRKVAHGENKAAKRVASTRATTHSIRELLTNPIMIATSISNNPSHAISSACANAASASPAIANIGVIINFVLQSIRRRFLKGVQTFLLRLGLLDDPFQQVDVIGEGFAACSCQ